MRFAGMLLEKSVSAAHHSFVTNVQEIEAAIAKLPRRQFADLAQWFDEERNRKWDSQMEQDAMNGNLQKLYERLEGENKGTSEITLNEVIDDSKLLDRTT